MGVQIHGTLQQHHHSLSPKTTLLLSPPYLNKTHLLFSSKNSSSPSSSSSFSSSTINGALPLNSSLFLTTSKKNTTFHHSNRNRNNNVNILLASSSSSNVAAPHWDTWSPDKASPSPPLSDVVWPSLGAFAAMAMLGKVDEILASRGIMSMTIAPLGAVCAVLFVTPKSPAARKYNMFMAQIGCSAIGVLAFSLLGPGWLARSVSLAASIAFMIFTRSTHPPAASLPLLFIDGAKLHQLNFWYCFFPGAAGCILLSLIQEMVCYLKENFKF